jgi:hypothetical protein
MNVVGVGGERRFGDGNGFPPTAMLFRQDQVAQGPMRRADISEQPGAKILADSLLRLCHF